MDLSVSAPTIYGASSLQGSPLPDNIKAAEQKKEGAPVKSKERRKCKGKHVLQGEAADISSENGETG